MLSEDDQVAPVGFHRPVEFPTDQVYGDTAEPTLRLITCGGDFDQSVRSYQGNLIVYAEHIATHRPKPTPPAS